jgi:hypothetical protein
MQKPWIIFSRRQQYSSSVDAEYAYNKKQTSNITYLKHDLSESKYAAILQSARFDIMNSLSPSLCSAHAFSYPHIPGAEVLSLKASQVSNVSKYIPEWYYYNHGNVTAQNLNF